MGGKTAVHSRASPHAALEHAQMCTTLQGLRPSVAAASSHKLSIVLQATPLGTGPLVRKSEQLCSTTILQTLNQCTHLLEHALTSVTLPARSGQPVANT